MKKLLVIIILFISLPVSQLFGQTANEVLMLSRSSLELSEYSLYFSKNILDFTRQNMIDEASVLGSVRSGCVTYAHSCEMIYTLGWIKLNSSEKYIKEYCEERITLALIVATVDELYEANVPYIDELLALAERGKLSLDDEIIKKLKEYQDEIRSLRILFRLIQQS